MISACEKGHKAEKAMELFVEMRQKGLFAEEITYNALFRACDQSHKLEKASELVAEILLQSDLGMWADAMITLDAHISDCSSDSISACEKGHRVEKAIELLAEMQQRGFAPKLITYISLITSCARGHEVEKTMALFVKRPQKGMNETFDNDMMHHLYRSRR